MVKNLPVMWETWDQFLDWEDPQEEGMASQSSILAWRILMDRGTWQATVHGVARVRHNLATTTTTLFIISKILKKLEINNISCSEN